MVTTDAGWTQGCNPRVCNTWKRVDDAISGCASLCVSLTGISNKIRDATLFTFIMLAKNYFPLFVPPNIQPFKIKALLRSAEKQNVKVAFKVYLSNKQKISVRCFLLLLLLWYKTTGPPGACWSYTRPE